MLARRFITISGPGNGKKEVKGIAFHVRWKSISANNRLFRF